MKIICLNVPIRTNNDDTLGGKHIVISQTIVNR